MQALSEAERLAEGLGGYPATRGTAALRGSIARWLTRRFRLDDATIDPDRHVLPVNGTREALFSFAQAMLSGDPNARVLMPNPCYQIYEGAALLRNGPGSVVGGLLGDIKDWMHVHEYESLHQLQGSMNHATCSNPGAFERANYMQALHSFV